MNAEKEKLWDKICSYRPKEKNKVEPKQWLIVHAVITTLTLLGLLFQFEYSNAYIFAFWGAIYFNVTIDFMLWFFSNPPSDSICNKIFTLLFLVMFLPLFIAVLIKEIYQRIMFWLNLKQLGLNPEIFGIYVLYDLAFILFLINVGCQTAGLKEDNTQKGLLMKLVIIAVYSITIIVAIALRKLLLAGFKYGYRYRYEQYKLNNELDNTGRILVALLVFIRLFFAGTALEVLFGFVLVLSSVISFPSLLAKFDGTSHQKEYLKKIASELEKCKEILAGAPQDEVLNVRFCMDTSRLLLLKKSTEKGKRVCAAIDSILTLTNNSEGKECNGIYSPYTYAMTKQELIDKIDKSLNTVADALIFIRFKSKSDRINVKSAA